MAVLLPLFTIAAVLVGILSFLTFRYSRRKMYMHAKSIPGAPELPLIGNAHQFAGNTKDILKNIQRIIDICHKNNGISKTWLGPKLYLGLTDPATIEIVLNTEMNKASAYSFMKKWLGNGLVSGTVPIWKRHRKMLSPAFNQKLLDNFVDIFAEQSEILVQKMSAEIGKGQFDVFKYISLCTLDIICESAMGVKINAQNNKNSSYIQAGLEQMQIINKRMFQIWLQPSWIFNLTKYKKEEERNLKILHDFTNSVVQKKKLEHKNKQESAVKDFEYFERPKCKAFLELMIEFSEKENKWSDAELREEADTMTIAGNDTSAHASSYVLTMLACLPHIQERVVQELREIYGDSKRPVAREDLPQMKYLEMVIKETLRLFPIAPVIVRALTQDIKLHNYTLPAGADCVVAVYGVHRDKRTWGENSNEFDPDRFLPENCAKRHPYSYIPFSAGPRNCIGKQYAMLSIKSLVSTVLRSYELSSDVDPKNMHLQAEVLLKPVDGHLISVRPRLEL